MSKKNLTKSDIVNQSRTAMNQWGELWRKNIAENTKVKNRSMFKDFEHAGVGRALLLVGNGYTLEENIDIIRENQHKVDILTCDKTLGALIEHGIKPTYCLVCDANVSYEKYLEPYIDQIQDTHLFASCTAQPQWLKQNWKSVCQFVNMDAINSQKEFGELSGIKQDHMPAATNVSNAMVVLATQSKGKQRANRLGYDKLLLIGFDYSWRFDGKYYAFDDEAGGKKYYMRHGYVILRDGTQGYSSANLMFSAKWLEDYITSYKLPVISCTEKTILNSVPTKDLSQQMNYRHRPEDAIKVRAYVEMRETLAQNLKNIENKLIELGTEHWLSFRNSI